MKSFRPNEIIVVSYGSGYDKKDPVKKTGKIKMREQVKKYKFGFDLTPAPNRFF